jgi:hypothetical protein
MLLHAYLAQQCAQHNVRRGAIPSLLQLSNVNKALRRYDALLHGDLSDADLIARIRACPLLAGDSFDEVLEETHQYIEACKRERKLAAELRARAAFTPHLWVVPENKIPSPIFVVAMLGVETFKRFEIPEEILSLDSTGDVLIALGSMLKDRFHDRAYMASPFGRAVQVLYRDTYDHSYVYDVEQQCWIDELFTSPPTGQARIAPKGSATQFPKLFS